MFSISLDSWQYIVLRNKELGNNTMIKQMHRIADKIRSRLQDTYPSFSQIEDINTYLHLLLGIACEFNLLNEVHALLELNLFNDVNQPLQLPQGTSNHGATLLGLSAFNGHIELVSYLVEVRLANINAKDANGDTPLH